MCFRFLGNVSHVLLHMGGNQGNTATSEQCPEAWLQGGPAWPDSQLDYIQRCVYIQTPTVLSDTGGVANED